MPDSNGNDVKLIQTQGLASVECPYMTLSHCWGTSIESSAMTTLATLDARLEAIKIGQLPLTFVHAIEVAKNLGVRYIWVDSLCIIQDFLQDWEKESASMSQVYSNAYCTIAAMASKSATEGLFRSFDTTHSSTEFVHQSEDGKELKMAAMKLQPIWEDSYAKGPWCKRGWTFQERELSQRVLYYTEEQVLWECRTCRLSEAWPCGIKSFEDPFLERFLDSLTEANQGQKFDLWHKVVKDYAVRDLTKYTDTLPALSGFARYVSSYFGGGQYLAGTWQNDLVRSLAWRVVDSRNRHASFVAPSWSWASIKGQEICFTEMAYEDPMEIRPSTGIQKLCLIETHIELAGPDPFGQLASGSLTVLASIPRAVFGPIPPCWRNPDSEFIFLTDLSGFVVGKVAFDVLAEASPLRVVSCIYLAPSSHEHIGNVGLALIPVGNETYKRLGLIYDMSLDLFNDAEVKELTLI